MDKSTIIECLSNSKKIYFNPNNNEWETAEDYLSGNIQSKIQSSERALEASGLDPIIRESLEMGIKDLKRIVPVPALPERIDLHKKCLELLQYEYENLTDEEQNYLVQNTISVSLGTTWIDDKTYTEFARHLFKTRCVVRYVANQYEITNEKYSYEVEKEYSVDKYNGYDLLKAALNLKSVRIYDEIQKESGQTYKIINAELTRAAQMKITEIQNKFKEWLWSDDQRAIELTLKYNQIFNSNRPREYKGTHLRFPGLNPNAKPTPEQCDDIWRIIQSKNTGIFAEVGFGKTWILTIAAMEIKRLKLGKRIVIAVLNSTLEQWAKEIKFLYPHARILYYVEKKSDAKKDKRAILYGQIKNSDWDIILLTHEQLMDIPISEHTKTKLTQKAIGDYEESYNSLKEKTTTNQEDYADLRRMLTKLRNEANKLKLKIEAIYEKDRQFAYTLWEDLEIDCLMIDEAHRFKNLGFPTNLTNVAGIRNNGSQRAFNLYSKILEMRERQGKIVFATGTPISNSIGELYILKKYLAEDELIERRLTSFDSWVKQFGEITEKPEVSVIGEYKIKQRFAYFKNLPELMEIVNQFASIRTHKTNNYQERPMPCYHTEEVPQTEAQKDYLKYLVIRADAVMEKKTKPEEDNMAKISAEARMMTLDMGTLGFPDKTPNSKLNTIIRNVYAGWKISEPIQGVQIIFIDLVNYVYEYIVNHLVRLGVPKYQISVIREAKNREEVYEQARKGKIRIILASTEIAGTGVNVQTRLAVLHHADAPWRPADVLQREGRIIRPKNLLKEVVIIRYINSSLANRMSFDTFAWQTLETKAKFYEQIWSNANKSRIPRKIADVYSDKTLSYAEVKALASGNPYLIEQSELTNRLKNLEIEKNLFTKKMLLAQNDKQKADKYIQQFRNWLHELESTGKTIGHIHNKPMTSWEEVYKFLKASNYVFEYNELGYIKRIPISTKLTNDSKTGKLAIKYQMDNETIPLNTLEEMTEFMEKVIKRKIELCHQKIEYYERAKNATIETQFPKESEIAEITKKLARIDNFIQMEALKEANTQLTDKEDNNQEDESFEEEAENSEVPEEKIQADNQSGKPLAKVISHIKQSTEELINSNTEWISTLQRAVAQAIPILGGNTQQQETPLILSEMGEPEIKIEENGQLSFF